MTNNRYLQPKKVQLLLKLAIILSAAWSFHSFSISISIFDFLV